MIRGNNPGSDTSSTDEAKAALKAELDKAVLALDEFSNKYKAHANASAFEVKPQITGIDTDKYDVKVTKMEANNAEGKITFTVELANKTKPEDKVTKDIVIADFAKVDQSAIDQLEQAQPKFATITDADKIDALFKYLENNKIIKYYFKDGILNYKSGKGKNDFAEITSKTDRVFDAESGLGLSGAEEFIFSKTMNKGKENEEVSVLPSSEINVEVDAANKTITLHFRVNKKITSGVFAFSKVKTVQIKFEAAKPNPEPAPEPEPTPVVPEPDTPAGKSAEEVANTILAPVSASYSQIINSEANALSEEQKQLITNYSNSVAQGLVKESLGVLKAVEGVLPSSENEMVAKFYNQVALVLNKVLVDALQNAINQKSETGINTIKDFINADKMNAIIEDVANVLTAKADDLGHVAKAVFDTLKTNDSTKNIANLDAFSAGMSDFFKNEIKAIAQQAKENKIQAGKSPSKALESMQALLPGMKANAAKKAHELLPDQKDYDAVKAVLKAKYEALEASVQSNLQLLIEQTMNLATLVDSLKLKKAEVTPETKKAAALSEAEIETLMGQAVPTLVEAAAKKTAFSAAETDFVAPKFAENKDYTIEAIEPVFYADALGKESTLAPEAKEALKAKMLNGINEIKYSIKVTSKTDPNDFKKIEKTYDVAGFISKAQADEIFKTLVITQKENVDKSAVKILPASAPGMTKAYKFLNGSYDEKSLKNLDLIEMTAPQGTTNIKIDNKIVSSDIKAQQAIIEPVLYLDEASKNYIFVYKDKTSVESEETKIAINQLPTTALSAKALANFYINNSSEKPYSVDNDKTAEKLTKALNEVLPSEVKPEQIVLSGKSVKLTGSKEGDTYQITAEMLAKMNPTVTKLYPLDEEGALSITVTFDTVQVPNAIYMLAARSKQTTDFKEAEAEKGELKIRLEGLKVKENTPEPTPVVPEPEQPKPETKVVQGTAFKLGPNANVVYIKATIQKKSEHLLQYYKRVNGYGISSGGDKGNTILLFADGMNSENINFDQIRKGNNKKAKYYLDGEFDAEKKTLTVKYQQKIDGKFVDVAQTFTLE
ncbi:lipoprotein 17-related variable surface protein [Mycoplasma sp. VS509_3]|uniref:lipoprotein 17-related variable surface protein n=1 Tax=unclassified Mycoplasma TaxID=2683645 RepID=UPI003AAFFF30